MVIVVDHDTGLLIWAAPGRETRTVHAFFDQLGAERCKLLTHLSADGADWISGPAAARALQAVLCADPFHVVSWATGALDEVRREVWRTARHAGAITAIRHGSRTIRVSSGDAKDLKHARYALWKTPRTSPAGRKPNSPGSKTQPLPLARLPAQRRTADRVQTQRRRRQARPDPMAILGRPLPHPRIHRTRERSAGTFPASTPPSTTGSATASSNRSTPKSASSPELPTASTSPPPSSPWPCSPSAASDHRSQEDDH